MKNIILITTFILSFSPAAAFAQNALDPFLDKILAASELPSCEQTQKALSEISETEFNAAITDIKNVKDQTLLTKYQEKFSKISILSSKCPQIQDQFANRLSLLTVHAHLTEKTANIDSIRNFIQWCENAINTGDCKKSAQVLAGFPKNMCDEAISGFQTVRPSSLSDDEYHAISQKLDKIITWGASCPEYQQVYQTCLTSSSAHFQPISILDPFFLFLHELKAAIKATPCDEISKLKLNDSHYKAAAKAIQNLTPAQFSPSDRAKIHEEMHKVYETTQNCPAAHQFVDNIIEKIFARQ